jgi:hypothetical protein
LYLSVGRDDIFWQRTFNNVSKEIVWCPNGHKRIAMQLKISVVAVVEL